MGNARYGYYGENGWIDVNADDEKAERVEIDVEEYNGLLVALDMVHRRALQQIDKSLADEHGYTLLRADEKMNKQAKRPQWLITKTTPYSIKISPEQAKSLIEKDLRDYYSYGFPVLTFLCRRRDGEKPALTKKRIKNIGEIYEHWSVMHSSQRETDESLYEWAGYNDKSYIVPLRQWLKSNNYTFTYDICKLSCNYAQGKYEVSYWGSKII